MNNLTKLIAKIHELGLESIVQEKALYAWETIQRIVSTGNDLQCTFPENQVFFDEDTALTARVLSNPANWGIDDPKWKEFVEGWNE